MAIKAHVIVDGPRAGALVRVVRGEVQIKGVLETWEPAPLRALAREYPVGRGPWPWLLEHGVRRPSPSGPSGPSDESRRPNQQVKLRLDNDVVEILDRLSMGRTRSDVVSELLRKSVLGK